MKSYVQVLATPTADTTGTVLLLHFDSKRYLIGSLSEGTQRLAVQMGARLLKLSECFMTGRSQWSNTGGLIGIILTIADATATSHSVRQEQLSKRALGGSKKRGEAEQELQKTPQKDNSSLRIFSPPNLNYTLATARRFVLRKGLPIEIHEVGEGGVSSGGEAWAPYWADRNVKVWALSVKPDDTKDLNGTKSTSPRKRGIDEVLDDDPEAELETQQLSTLSAKDVVTEMFCSTWAKDGLFESRLGDVVGPAELFIRDPSTKTLKRYHANRHDPDLDADKIVLVRKPWPGALVETLPPTQPRPESISYIIRNHKLRGKFNPGRATALKVEKGKKWSQLANMESVVNLDGDTITPDMVLGDSKEGGGLAIIDIPETSYVEPTLRRPEWRQPEVMAGVGAFVWICGRGVAEHPKLKEFMLEFKDYQHIVSSPEHCPNNLAFDSAAASTVRLGLVDPKRFNVPAHDNEPTESRSRLPENARPAARGQVIELTPSFKIDEKQVVPLLNIKEVESAVSPEVLEEASRAHAAIKADEAKTKEWVGTLPPDSADAEITTLGTGSALPSKYRNVSATLLRVPGWGNVLFDCGENTIGQLRRVFPEQDFKQVLRDLKIIFISHMHADHHLGTASVIKAWYNEVHSGKPAPAGQDSKISFDHTSGLAVVSDPNMLLWLHEYASVEDYGISRIAPICAHPATKGDVPARLAWYMPASQLSKINPKRYHEQMAKLEVTPAFLNLADLETVFVQHCHGARAVSVTFPSGFKASYSGDCRPSPAFSRIGQGSTVCIHEATFDDELRSDALHKKHSTTSEALAVAQAMNARTCVLTHFSQRYQKLPVIERAAPEEVDDINIDGVEEEDNGEDPEENVDGSTQEETEVEAVKFKLSTDMKVCVAFDYMRVKVGEIPELGHFTPALLKLFAEEAVETTK